MILRYWWTDNAIFYLPFGCPNSECNTLSHHATLFRLIVRLCCCCHNYPSHSLWLCKFEWKVWNPHKKPSVLIYSVTQNCKLHSTIHIMVKKFSQLKEQDNVSLFTLCFKNQGKNVNKGSVLTAYNLQWTWAF